MKAELKKGLKVTMTAKGTVKNPDGTTKEILLRAERPLTEEELKHGDYPSGCDRNRSD